MYKYFLKYKFATLFTLLSVTSIAQNITANVHIKFDGFTNVTKECIETLNSFLNKKDNRNLRQFVAIFDELAKKMGPVYSRFSSDLDKDMNKLSEEYSKTMNEVKKILEDSIKDFINKVKIQKKPEKRKQMLYIYVTKLCLKLFSQINPKTFFVDLIKKLHNLRHKAIEQDDRKLAEEIKSFIEDMRKQQKTWEGTDGNKEKKNEVFAIICKRMNQC